MEIHIRADENEDALLDRSLAAFDEIERIGQLMSFHDPESELTRINQTAYRETVPISPDMGRVLALAQSLHHASDGYFDPAIAPGLVRRGLLPEHGNSVTAISNWKSVDLSESSIRFAAPLKLDLGGIAKGYAVDRALSVIGNDVEATVNAGGDLAMTHWHGCHVEIRTPGSGGRDTLGVPMENRALATSAAYYLKDSHVILDPHDWHPFAGQESVSVFADSCVLADALTKICLLLPDPSALLRLHNATAFIIGLEGQTKRL